MDGVKGKAAIVTGGACILGKAQALLLAQEGAKVVVIENNPAGAFIPKVSMTFSPRDAKPI
jgi:NAD(P)-dependent dehydrogenase (short-subunit alcohol dehydrogenase family)